MPAEQAYNEAVKELRASEVIINEKAAIPTCDRIMRVLRKDPRGGTLESLGVNSGRVAPHDFLSDMAATNFFTGLPHVHCDDSLVHCLLVAQVMDPMGEFHPNVTNPSDKVGYSFVCLCSHGADECRRLHKRA